MQPLDDISISEIENLWTEYREGLGEGESADIEGFILNHPDVSSNVVQLLPLLNDLTLSFAGRARPTNIAEYEIVRQVGVGGMGVVYEAKSDSLRERVAIKVARVEDLYDVSVQRFEREARLAATLHHSNIVPIHQLGQTEDYLYYTMRLVDGPNLAEVLHCDREDFDEELSQKERQIVALADRLIDDWQFQAKLALQATEALHYAHRRGILHRDIKPANLLVEHDNLWIADFGLAKSDHDEKQVTVNSRVLGTPRYMAPEQLRGEADARSDVFGLGLVMYEMAIQSTQSRRKRMKIWQGGLKRPSSINAQVPVKLESIILKAIDQNPDNRYQSAEEFSDALRNYLHPADAGRPNRLTTILSLALAAVFGVMWWTSPDPTPTRQSPGIQSQAKASTVAASTADLSFTISEGATTAVELPESLGSLTTLEITGSDQNRFTFDRRNRALHFVEIPDFEVPADSNMDNVYEVQLSGDSRTWLTNVHIEDVNEPPRLDASMFESDGETILCDHAKLSESLALRALDDHDTAYNGLSFSVTGGEHRDLISMTSPGIFVFNEVPPPNGNVSDDGRDGYEIEVTIQDQTTPIFSRLVPQPTGGFTLINETFAPGGTLVELTSTPDCPIRGDVIDFATADGVRFYHIHPGKNDTIALYRTDQEGTTFRGQSLNKDCGLPVRTVGLATLDGTEFTFLVSSEQGNHLTLNKATLNEAGLFCEPSAVTATDLPPRLTGFSCIAEDQFQYRHEVSQGTTEFVVAFDRLDNIIHLPLNEIPHALHSGARGQAAWIQSEAESKSSVHTVRLVVSEVE